MKRHTLLAIITLGSLFIGACSLVPLGGASAPMIAPAAREAGDIAMEEMAVGAEPMDADGFAQSGVDQAMPSVQERLVIRNANLSIVVEDPAKSIADIARLAEGMGGFVVSSNVFQTTFGDSRFGEPITAQQGSITVRVPSDRLDEVLEMVRSDALEVRSQNVSGQDVTEEFTDLQSRLRNLESAEEQLREILDQAVETEDVLRVFEELRRVREEIEVLQGRANYLEDSARLSSVTVDLIPDSANQPIQIGRWTPEGTAKEAIEALVGALQTLADTAIWGLICVVPVALIVGVPGWLVIRGVLRRRRRQAELESAVAKPKTE